MQRLKASSWVCQWWLSVIEFQLQGLPPIVSNGSHHNWQVAAGIRKRWKRLAMIEFALKRPIAPHQRARVTIYRHSSREPDFEAMVIAAKPIIDALTASGIIADDSPKVIGR